MAGNQVAPLRKTWHKGKRALSGRSSKTERPRKHEAVRAGWLVSGLGRRWQGLLSALGNKQKEKPVGEEWTGLRGKSQSDVRLPMECPGSQFAKRAGDLGWVP